MQKRARISTPYMINVQWALIILTIRDSNNIKFSNHRCVLYPRLRKLAFHVVLPLEYNKRHHLP